MRAISYWNNLPIVRFPSVGDLQDPERQGARPSGQDQKRLDQMIFEVPFKLVFYDSVKIKKPNYNISQGHTKSVRYQCKKLCGMRDMQKALCL